MNLKTIFMIRFIAFFLCVHISANVFASIVINEIHYDPDKRTELVEFIELYNTDDWTVDLSGWSLGEAVEFQFPDPISIPSEGYIVIGQNPEQIVTKYNIQPSLVFGPFQGRLENEGEAIELIRPEGDTEDFVEYSLGFPWPTVGDPVSENRPGTSYSIQLMNPSFDNDLGGSWRSAPPTPGGQNSVFAINIPPHIRQVHHSPQQPKSGEPVRITAKVTDPDGVANVVLHYQIVDPGHYIAIDDAEYETQWIELPMNDDGLNGDHYVGDFIYSIEIPAEVQIHRRLIRYRISVVDNLSNQLTVPYADDPQPNFAYFVYDGVPSWTGAVRPGSSEEITYRSTLLSSIPVYHLITSKEETEHATWLDQRTSNEYFYVGTLVYDGIVYDHVLFRARGGVWRYAMGKNMWKFNMNRGHTFQARDNYGKPYKTKWDKLNLSANIQQGDYLHRGEQGMFESVGFKLFDMAGIESPETNFVHFRIVDEEHEDGKLNAAHPPMTNSGTQYDGDFWGLYLAVEQIDGRFLDRNDLPDGNLYKMEGGFGEIRNQSPFGVDDASDLRAFINGYMQRPAETWWRENIDVDRYYNYRSIVEGIHHYDIASGKNYYYYLNPITERWYPFPWDIDLTWADNMFGRGDDPFMQSNIFRHESIEIEYQNRQREICDLLFNPDQANQLIHEYASFIYNPDGESFVDADRAMWDYHWVMSDQASREGYVKRSGKAGQGEFYQIAQTKDFPGMLQIMKDYVKKRNQWIFQRILEEDRNIPTTPEITFLSDAYHVDTLEFEVSDFDDPNPESTFAALKWRIAEVEPFSTAWDPDGSLLNPEDTVTLFSAEDWWMYRKGTEEPSSPRSAWRQLEFDDSNWTLAMSPIGYGESLVNTPLNDMRYHYSTFYLRKTFEIEDLSSIGTLTARVLFDDGFNMWINGIHVLQDHVQQEELPYTATATHREDLTFAEYELTNPSRYLKSGTNVIAVQVINQYIDRSSDCFFDASLFFVKKEAVQGEEPDSKPHNPFQRSERPLKYEIDAIWESPEITSFQKQITIPGEKLEAGRTYRVRAKMKDDSGRWSHWSDPIQFTAEQAVSPMTVMENLRITELMYNPTEEFEFEFIELHNSNPATALSLDGFSFTNGIEYTFPADSSIPPNGYLLLTHALNDVERSLFRQLYNVDESIPIYGPYEGRLNNGGEQVELKIGPQGEDFIFFEYDNGRGWPLHADGSGHSLIPRDHAISSQVDGSLDYGGNWRASASIGGSPGSADPNPIRDLILNEISTINPIGNDWIEIYNPTANPISLAHWYLSDDKDQLNKWALPNFMIQPGQYISFDADTGFNAGGSGFGLNRDGEEVVLSYLSGVPGSHRVADSVAFKAQEMNVSWGRNAGSPDYWTTTPPTRDEANQESVVTIVVDEILYHPSGNTSMIDGEFIELYNPSSQEVSLMTEYGPWRINGGVNFVFPQNLSILPQGRLLLVSFDPQNETELAAFFSLYPKHDSSVQVVGPYEGNLSNHGERIAVEKLLDVDPIDGSLAWAIVDEVIYFDRFPWSTEADGSGKSLQRINPKYAGNDPTNWEAAIPGPGQERSSETPVTRWMMY